MTSKETFAGILSDWTNSEYSNASVRMRQEAASTLFKIFDQKWKPVLDQVFPRRPAVSSNGQVASIHDPFFVDTAADPGEMAKFMDTRERVSPSTMAFGEEKYQARMVRVWGPNESDDNWSHEIKAGFLDVRKALLTENALKKISRKLEYELCNYSFGDANAIAGFSNQSTARLKKFDALASSGDSKYLSGANWSDYGSDPRHDIAKMNLYINEMGAEDIKFGFIGPNTAFGLNNNSDLKDWLKYHFDATNSLIGETIGKVTMKKVLGQNSKDVSTNSHRMGYPGLGDIRPDSWTTRNKIDFMQHTVSATAYEWGLFTNGEIGTTFTAACKKNHKDTSVPYVHSWKDDEFEEWSTSLDFAFCPMINDFGEYSVIERLATKTV